MTMFADERFVWVVEKHTVGGYRYQGGYVNTADHQIVGIYDNAIEAGRHGRRRYHTVTKLPLMTVYAGVSRGTN
jgi:hypothetical protein